MAPLQVCASIMEAQQPKPRQLRAVITVEGQPVESLTLEQFKQVIDLGLDIELVFKPTTAPDAA